MSHLTYYDYPGFGERVRRDQHMSQAVRVGDVIETAGQGPLFLRVQHFNTLLVTPADPRRDRRLETHEGHLPGYARRSRGPDIRQRRALSAAGRWPRLERSVQSTLLLSRHRLRRRPRP